jgi:hypothetical protein
VAVDVRTIGDKVVELKIVERSSDNTIGRVLKNVWPPVGKRFLQSDLSSLRQRIRPVGAATAKMEIRASWSS